MGTPEQTRLLDENTAFSPTNSSLCSNSEEMMLEAIPRTPKKV